MGALPLLQLIDVVGTARPGEPVRVQATLAPTAPADTKVTISGLRARDVWLQAPSHTPDWRIHVVASSGAQLDRRFATVAVAGTPAAPMLEIVRNPFEPLSVVFRLADLDSAHPLLTQYDTFRWLIGGYEIFTGVPLLAQDLAPYVDDQQAWTLLPVEVTAHHQDGTQNLARRTVVLGSLYRLLRDEMKQVRPPVETDGRAEESNMLSSIYRGRLRVRNLEPVAIRLTMRRYEWLVTEDELASYSPDATIDIRLDPGQARPLEVEFDRSQAAPGAHGATVHLFGQSDDGTPVHTSATFDFVRTPLKIRPRTPVQIVRPTILDKIANVIEQFGGDPYEINVKTGGLVRLPEEPYAEGVTHQQLWSLDLLAKTAGRSGKVAPITAAPRPNPLAGFAASIRSFRGAPAQSRTMSNPDAGSGLGLEVSERQLPISQAVHAIPAVSPSRGVIAGRAGGPSDKLHHLFPDEPTAIVEGTPCDPDNPPDPDDIPEFFACQWTQVVTEQRIPARCANARKGDIILVPGGNGMIGGLLAHTSHPQGHAQLYAHCGIMTRNFEQISHATASKDWLLDHVRGVDPLGSTGQRQPTDGFDPYALRFQWPGGITQSAEAAYGGSQFTSVEGKAYTVAAFNLIDEAFIDNQWQLIPPLVLKPHPLTEYSDSNIRKRLIRVADEVRKLCVTEQDTKGGTWFQVPRQSKVHYRFYCYTDAAIALRDSGGIVGVPPADAGWAAGTIPAVCSSLIWLAARSAGEEFEGAGTYTAASDLEAPDLEAGAQVDANTMDGLYFYTEEQRSAGGDWFFDYLVEDIYKTEVAESDWFEGMLNEAASDLADDCANQIINTFAFDWADGDSKNSDNWKNPGVGRAVSPDNIMWWDKPESGRGLWGYPEPLVYHTARVEPVPEWKWRKTDGPGTITGEVRFQGQPVPGASLNAGGTIAICGPDGKFTMRVMEGSYKLKAEAYISDDAGMAAATVDVMVKHDETTNVSIDLQPPPERYRLVIVEADITFRDDEFTANPFEDDPDEYDSDKKHWEFRVHPWKTHDETTYEHGWGGECRVKARLTVDLNADLSVRVNLSGELFEGATENTNDLDGQNSQDFTVPKDTVDQAASLRITNQDENEKDTYADFSMKITNRREL